MLTNLPGVSVVQSPSILHHTAQACKLHCPPVLVTQASDDTTAANIGAKTCSVCHIEVPYSAYWRRAASQDGLQLVCKVCQKLQSKQLKQDRKLWQPSTGLLPCAVCDHLKHAEDFTKRIGTMKGVQYECRACAAKRLADVYQRSKLTDQQPSVAHKVCIACQKQKAAEAFHKNFASNSGLQSYCKQCQHHRQRTARQHRTKNAHMTNLA